MTLEFWNLEITPVLQHSLDILSIKEDADSITGIDFFSTEAKNCKLEFFEDSWTLSNLRNITNSNCLEDTRILALALKVNDNKYYIEQDKIKYNKKDNRFIVSGIDLMGLLLRLADNTYSFPTTHQDAIQLLKDTIGNVLDIDDYIIPYTIIDDITGQSVAIQNYQVPLQHDDYIEYLSGACEWGGSAWEVIGRWKWVGLENNDIVVYFYYRREWNVDPIEEYSEQTTISFKYKMIDEAVPELVYQNVNIGVQGTPPADLPTSIGGHDPSIPQLTYTSEAGTTYTIDDINLLLSGDVFFDNCTIRANDEGSSEYKQKKVLKTLMLLNNIYLYSNGDNIYLGNKTTFTGVATEILNSDLIEYKESYITFKEIDLMEEMAILESHNATASFLNFYYAGIKELFNMEINVEIVNNYNLSLLELISIDSNDYVITYIELDLDNFAYKIKAWSI